MKYMSHKEKELYLIAKIISDNAKGRKLALWGDSKELREVLKKYFNLEIHCVVTVVQDYMNGGSVQHLNILNGKSNEYYLIAFGRNYEEYYDNVIKQMGYNEITDFVYRHVKPIILENWDCSKQEYNDRYGNYISKQNCVIGKIVFRGYNNEINLGANITGLRNAEIFMCANQSLRIRDGVVFNGNACFRYEGFNGGADVYIGARCRFEFPIFRLINHVEVSTVIINNNCTFEDNVCFRANSGKKIIIGQDCMFSRDIQLQAGDGHSIFDVKTQQNINTVYKKENYIKNQLVIGEHVWICAKAFILNGTNIGSGSVIAGNSTVKGVFPNNCVVAGNPAKLVKKDTAWSREGIAENIASCGEKRYRVTTNDAKPTISGRNVLVVGGTRFMGIRLVEELLAYGNHVTVANRGYSQNRFGNRVNQLVLDLENPETVEKALKGKYYDVVFDNLAYCSNYVKEILENVKCGKYVQLSSVEVYSPTKMNLMETDFNPYTFEQEWCDTSVGYQIGKRQAEAAVSQKFSHINSVIVRVPYVTKTERLYYYCKNIVNKIPMSIDDLNREVTFVRETDVGKYLPWIASQDYMGPINFASTGSVKIGDILSYIEKETGHKAIIDVKNGEKSPFHEFGEVSFSMNMEKSQTFGYCIPEIDDWFWKLMDEYIARAKKEKVENASVIKTPEEVKQTAMLGQVQKNVCIVDKTKCTGCGACKNICPVNAISLISDEKGFLYPSIDENKCISCEVCKKVCPAIMENKFFKENKKCYALMAQDDIREVSSSGGAFTLLAEEIIKRGGVVFGAVWNSEYNVYQTMIDKAEDIVLLRGSKYVQSDTKYTFREVKRWLEQNREVLYVGTPCQINGLHSYLRKEYSKLITVDLLCRGNASNEIFKKFLKENYPDKEIVNINFKEKKPLGWGATTAYTFADGSIEKTNINNSVWMYAFLANFMDRDSCYSCDFANSKRVGDISIGDFWGVDNYKKELNDKKGTSIVITSSDKGTELVEKIRANCKKLEEVPVQNGIPYNSALSNHVRLSEKRNLFYNALEKMPFTAAVDRTTYGEKYSVGIVGWWYNLNYGGTITYYALNKAIQNLGYSVLMVRRGTYGPAMPNDNTVPMRFAKKHYNISRFYQTSDMHWLNYSCHAFVSGSDQLWNPYLEEYAGPEFFLSFVNKHNLKLSYASSFGNIDSVSNEFKDTYKKFLDRFDGITVREDYAVDICKKEFGLDAKQVCDPIFLCCVDEYQTLANLSDKNYGNKYLLNFLLDPDNEKKNVYHYVIQKKSLDKFVNFTDLQDIADKISAFGEDGVNANAEIEDFLNAYSNADFVVTDSFHGTCLAIIFNIPFISIANKKRGEKRFVSLLKWLGLMDRLVYDVNEIYEKPELLNNIDYTNVNMIIKDSRKEGYSWLMEHLKKMV